MNLYTPNKTSILKVLLFPVGFHANLCFYGNFIRSINGLKADFQSSHEAPRSSLRVLASN
jgi:hypothetical protein